MKFKLELLIDKSRAEVWEAFDNPENMKKWQPSLVKFEPVSGTPGQPGAISKLTHSEGGREFELIEKSPTAMSPTDWMAFTEINLQITL